MQKLIIKPFPRTDFAKQGGISLVEILVTVLILAVGSLGVAGMQIAGLKYAAGSYARTQATQLAGDMASRLKINRNEALDIAVIGDAFGSSPDYVVAAFANSFTATVNCITAECTSAELAAYDKSSWLAEISRLLSGGRGKIIFSDNTNADGVVERVYEISIRWRQTANTSDPDALASADVKDITYRVGI